MAVSKGRNLFNDDEDRGFTDEVDALIEATGGWPTAKEYATILIDKATDLISALEFANDTDMQKEAVGQLRSIKDRLTIVVLADQVTHAQLEAFELEMTKLLMESQVVQQAWKLRWERKFEQIAKTQLDRLSEIASLRPLTNEELERKKYFLRLLKQRHPPEVW